MKVSARGEHSCNGGWSHEKKLDNRVGNAACSDRLMDAPEVMRREKTFKPCNKRDPSPSIRECEEPSPVIKVTSLLISPRSSTFVARTLCRLRFFSFFPWFGAQASFRNTLESYFVLTISIDFRLLSNLGRPMGPKRSHIELLWCCEISWREVYTLGTSASDPLPDPIRTKNMTPVWSLTNFKW